MTGGARLCRIASRRVASPGVAETRLGTTTKVSPVTFNFRAPFEKPPLSLIPSFTTPPMVNWVGDRVPPSAVPCREQPHRRLSRSTTSAFGREKVFPPRTFERRQPAKWSCDSSRNRSYYVLPLRNCSTLTRREVQRRDGDSLNHIL